MNLDRTLSVTAIVLSLLALSLGGAYAGGLVTSSDIQNGTIKSSDIHKAGVRSPDIANGQVRAADMTLPPPAEIGGPGASQLVPPPASFTLLATVGTYQKGDPTSALQVDWTGSVEGRNEIEAGGCVFQVRVDGQPSQTGGGEVFGGAQPTSVAASVLFPGLPAGPHTIEVWARGVLPESTTGIENGDKCVLGPSVASVPQSFVVTEQVI